MEVKRTVDIRFTGEHISNHHKFKAHLETIDKEFNLYQYRLAIDDFIIHILNNQKEYSELYSNELNNL